MFEENSGRDASDAGGWRSYFPAAIMFVGDSDDVAFCAVLCKPLAAVGFVMDKSFHAKGHKRVAVVVMMAVEMCM